MVWVKFITKNLEQQCYQYQALEFVCWWLNFRYQMTKSQKTWFEFKLDSAGYNGKILALVVVVVVVYLTTNQRHLGYLSSGNGHLAGRYNTP